MANKGSNSKNDKDKWWRKFFDREFLLIVAATILLAYKIITPTIWASVVGAALAKMEVKRLTKNKVKENKNG